MKNARKILLLLITTLAMVLAGCSSSGGSSDPEAQEPVIKTQPTNATYTYGTTIAPLLVEVEKVPDGETLSYQWYKMQNGGWEIIPSATNNTYDPDKNVGSSRYKCIVTNTLGDSKKTKESEIATIIINPANSKSSVAQPVITGELNDATYEQNAEAGALSVSAIAAADANLNALEGTLTYQWYSNTENSNSGGTAINEATSSTYTPSTAEKGTVYYYVIVTATNNDATDENGKTSSVVSSVATITVNKADEPEPVEKKTSVASVKITTEPAGATYTVGDTAKALSVSATAEADEANNILAGTLSYQWYKNTTDSNSDGTKIDKATSSTYTPPTTEAGTVYYYVVVTATNNAATGNKTATANSNIVSIVVNEKSTSQIGFDFN